MKTKLNKAQAIANTVDCSHDIDITMFQRSELKDLRDSITDFLATGVETEELTSPGDVLYGEEDDFILDENEEE